MLEDDIAKMLETITDFSLQNKDDKNYAPRARKYFHSLDVMLNNHTTHPDLFKDGLAQFKTDCFTAGMDYTLNIKRDVQRKFNPYFAGAAAVTGVGSACVALGSLFKPGLIPGYILCGVGLLAVGTLYSMVKIDDRKSGRVAFIDQSLRALDGQTEQWRNAFTAQGPALQRKVDQFYQKS